MKQRILSRQGNLFDEANGALPSIPADQREKLLQLMGMLLLEVAGEDPAAEEDGDDPDHV